MMYITFVDTEGKLIKIIKSNRVPSVGAYVKLKMNDEIETFVAFSITFKEEEDGLDTIVSLIHPSEVDSSLVTPFHFRKQN